MGSAGSALRSDSEAGADRSPKLRSTSGRGSAAIGLLLGVAFAGGGAGCQTGVTRTGDGGAGSGGGGGPGGGGGSGGQAGGGARPLDGAPGGAGGGGAAGSGGAPSDGTREAEPDAIGDRAADGGLDGGAPDGAPWPDGPPGQLDPDIVGAVGGVSPGRVGDAVNRLVGYRTRHSCSGTDSATDGIGAARTWIYDQFQAIGGGLQVTYGMFDTTFCGTVAQRNVIAWIPGSDPRRLIVIGGHYDSLNLTSRTPTIDAPGANDSGSQTALTLEAARVMAGRSYVATVAFVAFAAEEQGLYGSKAFVQNLGTHFPGATVDAALIADIVGGDLAVNDAAALQRFRLFSSGTARETTSGAVGATDDTSPARGIMRAIGAWGSAYVPSMTMLPNLREDRPGRGSDHISFLDRGYAAVRFIETVENPDHQHNTSDSPPNMSPEYTARITQVVVATAATLARAPSAPQGIAAMGSASASVTVAWTAPASRTVDRYVVGARPVTENFYRKRVSVPAAQTAYMGTPADLGITEGGAFFVSVAAVGPGGHESLFAYPEYRCDATACQVQPGSLDVTAKR